MALHSRANQGELVLFLKQDSRLKGLSAEDSERRKEFQRLKRMDAAAGEARGKEAEEIARRKRELAELDGKIEEMKKRLGGAGVNTDDSLDDMLAMVQQKENQERKLDELRSQRKEEERKRQAEIAKLKRERNKKIILDKYPKCGQCHGTAHNLKD